MTANLRKGCLALGVLSAVAAAGPAGALGFGRAAPKQSAHNQLVHGKSDTADSTSGTSAPIGPDLRKATNGSGATASCPPYTLTRAFVAWKDFRWYTLLPGERMDNFSGTGWRLIGGAKIVSATLADGKTGQVLDLPSGASAVSPALCVNASSDPLARAMVADVAGARGVAMSVAYAAGGVWSASKRAGNIKDTKPGWARSKPIMLHAGALRGIHFARFTFAASHGEYRVYDFYVDPRMSH